jgi:hypothetical protein
MSNFDSLPDDIIQAQLDFYSQPMLAKFYGGMISELKREQQRRLNPQSPTADFDTPRVQLYLKHNDQNYRVKIFKHFLTLERQPGGDNQRMHFDDSIFAAHIYDPESQVWDIDKLIKMIDYEYLESGG